MRDRPAAPWGRCGFRPGARIPLGATEKGFRGRMGSGR
jgi:hypothetical protein